MLDHFINLGKIWILYFLYTLILGIGLVYVIASFQYGVYIKSIDYMIEFIEYYQLRILIGLGIPWFIGLLWYTYTLEEKIKNRDNCSIKTITLEELSKIWLPAERQQEEIRAKVMDEVNEELEVRQLVLSSIEFENKASYGFFEQYIKPNLRYVSIKELVVIRDLIIILEKDGGCPSVASMAMNPTDSETVKFKGDLRGDKTSYDIFKTFTLYDHSIRTAKKILRELEVADREFNLGWQFRIGKAVVIALAHDMGKIDVIKHLNITTPESIRKIQSHAVVSKSMFEAAFFDYEDVNEMGELIANHHTPKKDLDRLGVLLVSADKEARKEEMSLWSENERNGTVYRDTYLTKASTIAENDRAVERKQYSEMPIFDLDEVKKAKMEEALHREREASSIKSVEIEDVADAPKQIDVKQLVSVEDVSLPISEAEIETKVVPKVPSVDLATEVQAKGNEKKEEKSLPKERKKPQSASDGKGLDKAVATLFGELGVDASKYIDVGVPEVKVTEGVNNKKIKIDFDAPPEEFDVSSIESQFKEALIANLNTSARAESAPLCISYKNKILVSSALYAKIIGDLLGVGEEQNLSGYVNHVSDFLAAQGVLPDIVGGQTLKYSNYHWATQSTPRKKYICMSISGEYVGMGYEELEQNRKNSDVRDVMVSSFSRTE